MPDPLPIRQGSLVWATVRFGSSTKERPAVVITATEDIGTDPIVGVPITTGYPAPPGMTHVELPWHPSGQVSTGLRKRSAAVCDWLVELRPEEVRKVAGHVPPNVLDAIIRRVVELNTG